MIAISLMIFTILLWYGLSVKPDGRIQEFQEEFDLTLPNGTKLIHSEKNYGAMGDGFSLYLYQLPPDEMNSFIKDNTFSCWHPLPFGAPLVKLINERVHSFTTADSVRKINFDIQNGYYIFRNSSLPTIPLHPDDPKPQSYSNIVFAVLDIENNRIYYCTWDM